MVGKRGVSLRSRRSAMFVPRIRANSLLFYPLEEPVKHPLGQLLRQVDFHRQELHDVHARSELTSCIIANGEAKRQKSIAWSHLCDAQFIKGSSPNLFTSGIKEILAEETAGKRLTDLRIMIIKRHFNHFYEDLCV